MSATAIPTTEARRSAVTVAALNFLAGTVRRPRCMPCPRWLHARLTMWAPQTSGFAAKLIEYPFDTVKVLQQTQGVRALALKRGSARSR